MQLWAAALLLMRQSAAAPQLLFMEAAAAEARVSRMNLRFRVSKKGSP